jgi:hypothetical protein
MRQKFPRRRYAESHSQYANINGVLSVFEEDGFNLSFINIGSKPNCCA